MAFREFLVVVLLAVITHSYKFRPTEGPASYIVEASDRGRHLTRHNVDTIESDARPLVYQQNNYQGNGPTIQTNYKSAVQNNFRNPYPNTGNVNNFDGKRQEGINEFNHGEFEPNNFGRADTHWDGYDRNVNDGTRRQKHRIGQKERNRGGENVFGGFVQTNFGSHVVNNYGGYSVPEIPDIRTRDQPAKPRGTGNGFTLIQHNVNSPVTEVYLRNPDDISVVGNEGRPPNTYGGTDKVLHNYWTGINEHIYNNLAEVQRHLHNTMDNLSTKLEQIPYNNGYYWTPTYYNPGFPTDYGTGVSHNFNNYWSITPTHYLNPGLKPNDYGTVSNGAGMSPTEERPAQEHSVQSQGKNFNDRGSEKPGQHIPDGNNNDIYNRNDPRNLDGGSVTTGPYPGTTYRPSTNYNNNGIPAPVDSTRNQQGGLPQVGMDGKGNDGYSTNDKW